MGVKTIVCACCGKSHNIDLSEYNYQVKRGRENFFCSNVCSGMYNNAKFKKPVIRKACEYCGREFDCYTPYTKRFCSRSCASAGSITAKRLAGNRQGGLNSTACHDITAIQTLLKKREAWKYVEVKKLLDAFHIEHEFEYLVQRQYIFDLFIPAWNVLIEFDGTYHSEKTQSESDKNKTKCAEDNGYELLRIITDDNVVIPASVMYDLISKHQ